MVLETASPISAPPPPAPQPLPAPLVFSTGSPPTGTTNSSSTHHVHAPLARFTRPVPMSLLPPHHPHHPHFSAAAAAHFSAHFAPYGKLQSRFPFTVPAGFLHHPAGPRFAAVAAASLAAAAAAAAAASNAATGGGGQEQGARRVAALHQLSHQQSHQDDRGSGASSPKKGKTLYQCKHKIN